MIESNPVAESSTEEVVTPATVASTGTVSDAKRARLMTHLLRRRYSGIWVLVALIITFGLTEPQYFLTQLTLRTILSNQAVIGILAIAAILPLATGMVDLSIAGVAGFSMVFSSWLTTTTSIDIILVCMITLVAAGGFGVLSGMLITRLGVNSLVTTLGVSTVALGLSELLSGGNVITPRFGPEFLKLAQSDVSVVPLPALYFIVIGAGTYFLLEHMPLGRRCLATGSNPIASRLAGIKVNQIRFGALISSATISGFGGIVLAAQIGTASDTTGPGLLLPTLAIVFLGATQFRNRVNVVGTALAALLLGTGIKGLELMGAPPWVNDFFYGCMLLLAVALAAESVQSIG